MTMNEFQKALVPGARVNTPEGLGIINRFCNDNVSVVVELFIPTTGETLTL